MTKAFTYPATATQGAGEYRNRIASYDSKTAFFKAIFSSLALERFAGRKAWILDGISGPGRLGLDIKKELEGNPIAGVSIKLVFNDVNGVPLANLRKQGFETILCDIRDIGTKVGVGQGFDIAAIRYGLKDLAGWPEQLKALKSVFDSLVSGGRLVIADMLAYTLQGQVGVVRVHSAKQVLAGRDLEKEGQCFIPQRSQWIKIAKQAGFSNVNIVFHGTSDVNTKNWAGQFGKADDAQMIARMNQTIIETCNAIPEFKNEFNVVVNNGEVTLQFPIMVLQADKF